MPKESTFSRLLALTMSEAGGQVANPDFTLILVCHSNKQVCWAPVQPLFAPDRQLRLNHPCLNYLPDGIQHPLININVDDLIIE